MNAFMVTLYRPAPPRAPYAGRIRDVLVIGVATEADARVEATDKNAGWSVRRVCAVTPVPTCIIVNQYTTD